MRVVIFTSYKSPLVEALFNSHHSLVGIIEDASVSKSRSKVCQFFQRLHLTPLSILCKKKRISYYYDTNDRLDEMEGWLRTINPELLIISSISHLIKDSTPSIPKYGAINLHPSYLPKYRGPNPWFWFYYNNETYAGMTVHYIDSGEDTGEILCQKEYPIPYGIDITSLKRRVLTEIGAPLILDAIDIIEQGRKPQITQLQNSPTMRARRLKPDEYTHIIDWATWDVERVWRMLRGFSQIYPLLEEPQGIYIGQKWDILDFQMCDTSDLEKGKIHKNKDRTFIACKDGIITLSCHFQVTQLLKAIKNFIFRHVCPKKG